VFKAGDQSRALACFLEHGASMNAENNKGEAAFQVALEGGHHKVVELLWGLGIEYP